MLGVSGYQETIEYVLYWQAGNLAIREFLKGAYLTRSPGFGV